MALSKRPDNDALGCPGTHPLSGWRPSAGEPECAALCRRGARPQVRGASDDPLVFYINVLCDLRAQGWTLRLTRSKVLALVPTNGLGATEEKARIRAAHAVDRDIQLQQPSVKRFVEDMERRRLHKGEWFSIFSLMRDGRELADRLTAAVESPGGSLKDDGLRAAIDPYIQVARAGERCRFTGLDVFDIWRYFRHTWSTTYQSTPGRKIFFLVRDRAAANHPVVGNRGPRQSNRSTFRSRPVDRLDSRSGTGRDA